MTTLREVLEQDPEFPIMPAPTGASATIFILKRDEFVTCRHAAKVIEMVDSHRNRQSLDSEARIRKVGQVCRLVEVLFPVDGKMVVAAAYALPAQGFDRPSAVIAEFEKAQAAETAVRVERNRKLVAVGDLRTEEAWQCSACSAIGEPGEQSDEPLYECADDGTVFNREEAGGNRCPQCNKFAAKVADVSCPECGEGPLEDLTAVRTPSGEWVALDEYVPEEASV